MCPDDHFVPSHEKRACRIAIPVDGAEMLREPGIFQLWFFVLVVAVVLFGGPVVVVAAIFVVAVVAVVGLVCGSLGVRVATIVGALARRGYGAFLRIRGRCRIAVAMRKGCCCLGTCSRLCLRLLA